MELIWAADWWCLWSATDNLRTRNRTCKYCCMHINFSTTIVSSFLTSSPQAVVLVSLWRGVYDILNWQYYILFVKQLTYEGWVTHASAPLVVLSPTNTISSSSSQPLVNTFCRLWEQWLMLVQACTLLFWCRTSMLQWWTWLWYSNMMCTLYPFHISLQHLFNYCLFWRSCNHGL